MISRAISICSKVSLRDNGGFSALILNYVTFNQQTDSPNGIRRCEEIICDAGFFRTICIDRPEESTHTAGSEARNVYVPRLTDFQVYSRSIVAVCLPKENGQV